MSKRKEVDRTRASSRVLAVGFYGHPTRRFKPGLNRRKWRVRVRCADWEIRVTSLLVTTFHARFQKVRKGPQPWYLLGLRGS